MSFLTDRQANDVMKRFPEFKLSYEIMSHKKVSDQYDVCLAIPYGKKAFLWYTFWGEEDVCFYMELGRDKKINRVLRVDNTNSLIPYKLAFGTLLYGTMCEIKDDEDVHFFFTIEDMLFSGGNSLIKLPFNERLGFLNGFFRQYGGIRLSAHGNKPFHVSLPIMWNVKDNTIEKYKETIPYTVHHYQYRSLTDFLPYINVSNNIMSTNKTPDVNPTIPIIATPLLHKPKYDFSKPQYRMATVFEARADIQPDIYHLYTYGKSKTDPTQNRVYYGTAYIAGYQTSVFMNDLFRNIKENKNLDFIEESDDEEDFEDVRPDKYVNLERTMNIECVFHTKFKKWTPMRVARAHSKIVHICSLI